MRVMIIGFLKEYLYALGCRRLGFWRCDASRGRDFVGGKAGATLKAYYRWLGVQLEELGILKSPDWRDIFFTALETFSEIPSIYKVSFTKS